MQIARALNRGKGSYDALPQGHQETKETSDREITMSDSSVSGTNCDNYLSGGVREPEALQVERAQAELAVYRSCEPDGKRVDRFKKGVGHA